VVRPKDGFRGPDVVRPRTCADAASLGEQLGIADASVLKTYGDRENTRLDHVRELRQVLEYTEFAEGGDPGGDVGGDPVPAAARVDQLGACGSVERKLLVSYLR
jgi:hypothetical protein